MVSIGSLELCFSYLLLCDHEMQGPPLCPSIGSCVSNKYICGNVKMYQYWELLLN